MHTGESVSKKPRLSLSVTEKVKHLKSLPDTVADASVASLSAEVEQIGFWLADGVANQETGIVHACLSCLEKLPITVSMLQATRIGKTVNESMKTCSNQVAVERARKLIVSWKSLISPPESDTDKKSKKSKRSKSKSSPSQGGEEVEKDDAGNVLVVDQEDDVAEQEDHVVAENITDGHDDETGAEDALASLLESLPEIQAIADNPNFGRRGIVWKPDAQLVQMVEFAITETCLDLRRRIEETHGGLNQLHPHGADTADELKRFRESRRKERAMGGNRLREHFLPDDDDDEIEETIGKYAWPIKIRVLVAGAVRDEKKLNSYERQDLADMHGSRLQVVYPSLAQVPDSPSEPAFGMYKVQFNETLSVPVKGFEDLIDLDAGPTPVVHTVPVTQQALIAAPNFASEASFEDEFVKLESNLQTAILASEELLNMFTREPMLLRELTREKLELILSEFRKPTAQPTVPPFIEDRKSWGAATIRSSVRNQVMNSFPGAHAGPPHAVSGPYAGQPHFPHQSAQAPPGVYQASFPSAPGGFYRPSGPYPPHAHHGVPPPAGPAHMHSGGPPQGPYAPNRNPGGPPPGQYTPHAHHGGPPGGPYTQHGHAGGSLSGPYPQHAHPGGPPYGSPRGLSQGQYLPHPHPGGPPQSQYPPHAHSGAPPHAHQGAPPHAHHGGPPHAHQGGPPQGHAPGPPSQFHYDGAPRQARPPRGYSREYERR